VSSHTSVVYFKKTAMLSETRPDLRTTPPSLSLVGFIFVIEAVRRGSLSFSWFVVASAACVYEAGLLLVCACRTSAASVEPLPRGSRAVAFPLWLQVLSCSTWLIIRCSFTILGHIQACPTRFLAQKTFVIFKKRWPNKNLFLGRPAC